MNLTRPQRPLRTLEHQRHHLQNRTNPRRHIARPSRIVSRFLRQSRTEVDQTAELNPGLRVRKCPVIFHTFDFQAKSEQPSCASFGADLKSLAITTAAALDGTGGDVFACEPDVAGMTVESFDG